MIQKNSDLDVQKRVRSCLQIKRPFLTKTAEFDLYSKPAFPSEQKYSNIIAIIYRA